MANRYKNLIYSTAEYTHSYGGFKGVELNAGELIGSPHRLAYSQNMYKDYDGDGADVIESVPGYRCFTRYKDPVHALYYQRSLDGSEDHLIVHTGSRLMRHQLSDIDKKDVYGKEIASVKGGKSFGFEYGRFYYIMDGAEILQIDSNGITKRVGDDEASPYVPTTYVSGESYEQRNLLTNRFNEEYYVADPTVYLYSTDGLKFSITDPYLRYCSLIGVSEDVKGDVYVPSYVDIAGISYKVISVGDYAMADNLKISAIYLPHGLTSIGKNAFEGCDSLITVVTPITLETIGRRAFRDCQSLTYLYLGSGVNSVGEEILDYCYGLDTVYYELGEEELKKIEGSDYLSRFKITYYTTYNEIKLALPFHDKVEKVNSVSVDGEEVDFATDENDGYIKSVIIKLDTIGDATGIKVVTSGYLAPLGSEWQSNMTSNGETSTSDAIIHCTVAEVFDGRIFLSGNPDLPNTVFYTESMRAGQDGALYFGRYNYICDGVGSYKVRAMLAVRDMLAVFKEGDDGSGSIFYHKKAAGSGGIDSIYPVAYVHSGICSVGGCLSFLDDPVFLSAEGLMALNNENINYQRNVVCRSHNVNYTLLKEDLSKACLCEWLGYLVLGVNGKILLADSRAVFNHPAGSREYEWFLLRDIGAHISDKTVYVYAKDPYLTTVVHPTLAGERVDENLVYSTTDASGVTYYYVQDGAKKYRVVPTEEMIGGEFSPATVFISYSDRLFFATDKGHVCVFNNDKRGVAPPCVTESEDYDEAEYQRTMGNKIHPLYYSFAGHAPTYVVKTALDDCGVPHLTKSTVKKSLVIKAKSYTPDAIRCEVIADTRDPVYVGSFPAVSVGFDNFDFTSVPWYVSRYTSVTLSENEKRWVEKQICLSSDTFASPISVYSITYRYVIKGKIKNNA